MGETHRIACFASFVPHTEVSTCLTAESPEFTSQLLTDSKQEALLFSCHLPAKTALISSTNVP